ncbi:flagellin-like protein [Rhodothalassium salexigens DSM 2132]|uniref:Flagellin-like protein n=1 Tax=Rhodothalassium salexigens DSM 2132 TaxID=1188247 RepID=A0A4R2P611_RHOSA|nr:flagellin [Rhodothalassium salexigens]MBB4212750.1 flagellin-like hook-associated protein FlgL [Rhodothalassium salexigens DSM 2132]MBK1640141.1 hypothetical protein [Rhodothalassium salexigens DSM 2132]TCP30147.1 flagellin-like protein [Rhodothalassium salexigens DSM 2132]
MTAPRSTVEDQDAADPAGAGAVPPPGETEPAVSGARGAAAASLTAAGPSASGLPADLLDKLTRADRLVSAALTAAETVALLLEDAAACAAEAADPAVEAPRRATLSHIFGDLADRINGAIKLAALDGPGLIEIAGLTLNQRVGLTGSTHALPAFTSVDLRAGLPDNDLALAPTAFADRDAAERALAQVAAARARVDTVVADLGRLEDQVSGQVDFIAGLLRSLSTGLSGAAGPDLERERANLRALRLQQDLSESAQGLANTAQRSILSLL